MAIMAMARYAGRSKVDTCIDTDIDIDMLFGLRFQRDMHRF